MEFKSFEDKESLCRFYEKNYKDMAIISVAFDSCNECWVLWYHTPVCIIN